MNISNQLKTIMLTITTALILNGCSTMILFEKSQTTTDEVGEKEHLVLSDKIIAVGFPSQPIKDYENAIVFAGEAHSYLAKPRLSALERYSETQDIFQQMFEKIDMKHLYIDTQTKFTQELKPEQPIDIIKISQVTENTLKLKQAGHGSQYNKRDFNNATHYIKVAYIKEKNQLTNDEQENLQSMDFVCSFQIYQEREYLTCSRGVGVELAIAPKVTNFESLTHRFKQPLNLEVYQDEILYKENNSKQWLKVFTPVTVAFDIVTSPIQIAGYAFLGYALKGIGTAF